MDLPRWFQEIASVVTTIGVCVGVLQLSITKRQAVADALAHEYRQIIGKLPTAALLGETFAGRPTAGASAGVLSV